MKAGFLGIMMLGVAGATAAGPISAARAPDAVSASLRIPSRGGTIALKVTDYDRARQAVLAAAQEQGAEVLHSKTEVNFQGKQQGWVRLRLAADRLPLFLGEVRGVGKLYAENIATEDHTSEYEELERRIERLREHQPRLASLLQSSRRLRGSDILFVQDRLFRAGVDEGALMQRRADLERSARVATLVVELFEPEPRRAMDLGNYYASASLRARGAMYRGLARAATAGAYALTFAPFWIPGLLVVLFLGRWLWRRGRMLVARLAPVGALLAGAVLARLPESLRSPQPPNAAAG
jgi:uncharacterized protein DUF4349